MIKIRTRSMVGIAARAIGSAAVLLMLSAVLPLAVLADDCSDTTAAELASCAGFALGNTLGFFAGAAIAIASAAGFGGLFHKYPSIARPVNLAYDTSFDYAAAEVRYPGQESSKHKE